MWKKRLPTRESLLSNRWLVRFFPRMRDPRLWKITSRGVALGVALGVFFGLLTPFAQIPLAVASAIWFRANILFAASSTLVTNPITVAPVYVLGYKLGDWLIPDHVLTLFPAGVDFVIQLFTGLFLLALLIAPSVYMVVRWIMARHIFEQRVVRLTKRAIT